MSRIDPFKANIVVKQVTSPVASDPWEIHETLLMVRNMIEERDNPSAAPPSLTVSANSSLVRPQ